MVGVGGERILVFGQWVLQSTRWKSASVRISQSLGIVRLSLSILSLSINFYLIFDIFFWDLLFIMEFWEMMPHFAGLYQSHQPALCRNFLAFYHYSLFSFLSCFVLLWLYSILFKFRVGNRTTCDQHLLRGSNMWDIFN